jgi:hypothetical protein
MATATAAGGPDRMAATAAAAELTGAVAAQGLLGLLALAVSIVFLFPLVRPVVLLSNCWICSDRDNCMILLPLRTFTLITL